MYPVIEKFLADLPVAQPLTYKAVYPKRILPPAGYLNPKYYALSLWSFMRVGFELEANMLPHLTGVSNALMQLEYRVPTFFVRSEFAQAVAQTEPPKDFKFSEIIWPLDTMLFVIPSDFSLKYFGFLCPFISVSRIATGIYPDCLKHLPKCEMPLTSINRMDNRCDRINIVYHVYSESTVPVDYTGSYPLDMNVDKMADAPFEDSTYLEEARYGKSDPNSAVRTATDLPHGETERLFNLKVQAFAVKLMLAITAMPHAVANGLLARPGKVKKGNRTVDELWHPNLIGWDFKAQRPAATTSGEHGTHASPRLHWRRGTWRNQPHGPRPWTAESPKKLIWIQPVLVNAQEETK